MVTAIEGRWNKRKFTRPACLLSLHTSFFPSVLNVPLRDISGEGEHGLPSIGTDKVSRGPLEPWNIQRI